MATPIQLKTSNTTSIPGALTQGEPAYTANGDVLYIGSNGAIVAVGGKRNPGVLTANQALVANSTSYLDVIRTANLYIGAVTVNVINAVANSTVLGAASNNELTTTWGIKTYVDGKVAGAAGAPTGANTNIQFNDSGTFGGSTGLVFDKTSNNMTLGNTFISLASLNGNSTVNSYSNATMVRVANSTASANHTPAGFFVGTTSVNAGAIAVQDVVVSGNLTINGTLSQVDATNLVVKDSLIRLANGNLTTDTVDVGFYGSYGNSTVTQFSGLYRDASNASIWTLFNSQAEPTTTVDTGAGSYTLGTLNSYLKSGILTSNSTTVNITANSTVSAALTVNSISLSTQLGVASGGTGLNTIANNGILVGNTVGAMGVITGTDGQVLQSVSGVPVFAVINGGSF